LAMQRGYGVDPSLELEHGCGRRYRWLVCRRMRWWRLKSLRVVGDAEIVTAVFFGSYTFLAATAWRHRGRRVFIEALQVRKM